jgi:hypothetical protein
MSSVYQDNIDSGTPEPTEVAATSNFLHSACYQRAASNLVTDTTSTTAQASKDVLDVHQNQCANCHNLETTDLALKPCNKCQTTLYCSRDCQKAGWKLHKKECPALAQIYSQNHEPKMAVARAPPKTGRGGKGIGKWEYDT